MSKNILAVISFLAIAAIVSPVLGFTGWMGAVPTANISLSGGPGVPASVERAFSGMTHGFSNSFSSARGQIDAWISSGSSVGAGVGRASGAAAGGIANILGGN